MVLDIILAVSIILMVIWGIYKGFISGVLSFLTGILLYISLSAFTLPICEWVQQSWGVSYIWGMVISIAGQILIISAVMLIVTKILELIVKTLRLSIFNRIFGGFFGLLAMQFIITLLIILLNIANFEFFNKQVEGSKICAISSEINSDYLKKVFGKDINTYIKDYLNKNRGL